MAIGIDAVLTAGDVVRVKNVHPPGHRRTPYYIRGHRGVVQRCCGQFLNPEELAHGLSGLPRKRVYRVVFLQRELWPDYVGADADTVAVDVYEHWLEVIREAGKARIE
jgi:nitrile hydratase